MKRLFTFLALVLGLVSCQTEPEGFDVNVGGEQDVNITVSLPESTRAASNQGFDLSKLSDLGYELRYILEISYNNNVVREVETSNTTSVTFPVRLAPNKEYTFTVWADLVKEGTEDDLFYNTTDLKNITLKSDVDAEIAKDVELRDAYTHTDTFNFTTEREKLNMTLTRPFAKVRVVATDLADVTKFGIIPTNAGVEYTSDIHTSFNAVAGDVNANIVKPTFDYNIVANDYDEVDEKKQLTVYADYIFVPKSGGTISFKLDVNTASDLIKSNSFNTAIPVERNKVTSIVGDVLTEGGNVSIKIDGTLGQKETINYVDTAEDLQEIINRAEDNKPTTIILGGNVVINNTTTRAAEPTYGLLIPAGKSVVFDLNGFTISQTKTQTTAYSMIENRGTLTIKDSSANKAGKFSYTDNGEGGNYVSNTVQNSGILTIDGGTIENSSSATVASNGYPHPIDNSGTLTINGGTFTNNANYSSMRIWCTTDDDTIVTVYGGTFNGSIDFQTPSASANKGTLTIEGGTFNADTYTNCAVRLLGFGADVDEMNGYVRGGQFNGAIALRNWSGSELNSKVFDITGGTFTTAAKENTAAALINDDYVWVEAENDLWTLERKDDVAKIGDFGYTSLAKAVAAAQNGDTVLFIADVEQEDGVIITDKNITIDLNDYTFTVSNGANTNNRNFKVNGSSVVTIKNGTMVAAGNYSSGAYGTLRTEGTANVTLEGVKLYNYRGNGLNVKALSGTTVTITDAEVYSQYGGGIESAGGTIELNNVTVEQKGMYTAPYNSMAISVNGGGTVTVNSGTYSTECITAEEANNQGTSHGPWCAGVLNSGGTLIIKGGTFSNDNFGENALATNARGLLLADTGANIQIEGGTFNAVKAIIDMTNNLGDASRNPSAIISGGDFSADPQVSGLYASHLIKVAEGYVVDEKDGRYEVVKDVKIAKVGNVEYRKIDDAIAAWTNNATLTLLADVTLNDVVMLNSTEHHILNLGTYTLTAASGKDAFVIKACGTGDAERTAITIKADETNPGCIDAGNKRIVYYKYADGGISGNDRPIIKIEGGVFNGSTSSFGTAGIYVIGSAARKAATINISGGTFNCSINGSGKSKLIISGGLFHYSVGSQGDSTALRLISGGTFKTLGFMTADSENTKFWFGTSMGNSNVGLYINDDNYLVVGGPVITEFGDKFAAKATNATKWSSYLQYSSAAANGLYYTNADAAIAKHGAANVELKN